MAQNIQIDPVAQDYVFQNGSPVPSDRVLEAAYYAMMIQQGKWQYGAVGQGSLIYTLEAQKRASDIEQRFSAYAQAAIQAQVIDPGKATASAVSNIQATRTASSNQVNVVPSNTQLSGQLNFNPV